MDNKVDQKKEFNSLNIFLTFFYIGCFAFGGFMSLIAVVNNIIVDKKKWVDGEKVLDGISIANLLPGPMAVNVCTYLGYKMRGNLGALASFTGILTPSFILIILFAINYDWINNNPYIQEFLFGIYPVLAAIIIHTFLKLSGKIVQEKLHWLYILLPTIILLTAPKSIHLFLILGLMFSYGVYGYLSSKVEVVGKINKTELFNSGKNIVFLLIFVLILFFIKLIPEIPVELNLFSSFGSLSVLLFGGGYVFIPLLEDLVVNQNLWVNQKEFIDAIAIGQVTPGPIVITVSYIGYKAAGMLGAIVSTIAIFGIPAFLMVQVGKVFHFVSENEKFKSAIKFLRFCGIGLILYAGIFLLMKTHEILPDNYSLRLIVGTLIFLISFFSLRKWNVNIFIVILFGGIAQILTYLFLIK